MISFLQGSLLAFNMISLAMNIQIFHMLDEYKRVCNDGYKEDIHNLYICIARIEEKLKIHE